VLDDTGSSLSGEEHRLAVVGAGQTQYVVIVDLTLSLA
jgi:hypothetical protein